MCRSCARLFRIRNVPGHCGTVAAGGLREVASELAVPIRGQGQAKWRTQFPVPPVSIASGRLTKTAFVDLQELVVGLSKMPDPQRLHDQRLPAHQPLGARGGRQADAAAARSDAKAGRLRCQSVEHTFGTLKSCTASNALPDEDATESTNRDQLAGSGIQPEANNADPRRAAVDRDDAGVRLARISSIV